MFPSDPPTFFILLFVICLLIILCVKFFFMFNVCCNESKSKGKYGHSSQSNNRYYSQRVGNRNQKDPTSKFGLEEVIVLDDSISSPLTTVTTKDSGHVSILPKGGPSSVRTQDEDIEEDERDAIQALNHVLEDEQEASVSLIRHQQQQKPDEKLPEYTFCMSQVKTHTQAKIMAQRMSGGDTPVEVYQDLNVFPDKNQPFFQMNQRHHLKVSAGGKEFIAKVIFPYDPATKPTPVTRSRMNPRAKKPGTRYTRPSSSARRVHSRHR